MSDTIKVTLAYPYTDEDGKTHPADKTISVPRHVGHDLLHFGQARHPDPAPRSPASTATGNPATTATAQKEE